MWLNVIGWTATAVFSSIERAKQLLGESVLPLADIALEAGFQTQSRFTTAFRRTTGFTPAVYRKGAR